jgi:opacity protein-like surface antigen
MGNQLKFAAAIALLLAIITIPGHTFAAKIEAPQSTNAILQRLDALEKRSARLEKLEAENAALRDRVRRLELPKAEFQNGSSSTVSPVAHVAPPTSIQPLTKQATPRTTYAMATTADNTPSNWTGVYWGASIGGALTQSRLQSQQSQIDPGLTGNMSSLDSSGSGGLGATVDLFAGYNTKIGQDFLVGLQVEGSLSNIDFSSKGTKLSTFFVGGVPFATSTTNIQPHVYARWMTSILARGGWFTTPSTMIYGIGGWTLASFEYHNATDNLTYQPGETFLSNGITGGVGIEKKMDPNWSVRAEYRYTHFMSTTVDSRVSSVFNGTPTIYSMQTTFENNMHALLFGIAYLPSVGQ